MTRKHIAQGVGAVALIAVGVVAGVAWTERLGRGRLAGGGGIAAAPEAVQASRQAANTDESVEVVLTLEAVARRKKIALDVRVEPGEAALLDEKLVRRALENLLGNALKYTPSGRDISVGVRRLPEKIAIEVADRGPGIPADMKGSMFRYRSGATR